MVSINQSRAQSVTDNIRIVPLPQRSHLMSEHLTRTGQNSVHERTVKFCSPQSPAKHHRGLRVLVGFPILSLATTSKIQISRLA